MRYHVVVEYDPETRNYTATVPGIPTIVVDAKREASALRLARDAIAFFMEATPQGFRRRRSGMAVTPLRAKIVTVTV